MPVMTNPADATVLVADDDIPFTKYLRELLEGVGYRVLEAYDGEFALQQIEEHRPDVVLTDIYMPFVEGIGLILATRRSNSAIPIIAMSGGGPQPEIDYLRVAGLLGADATLKKPFEADVLLNMIARVLRSRGDS